MSIATIIIGLIILGVVLYLLKDKLDPQIHLLIIVILILALAWWVWTNLPKWGIHAVAFLSLIGLTGCVTMVPVGFNIGYQGATVGVQFQPQASDKNPISKNPLH